jgi:hypothetical protein
MKTWLLCIALISLVPLTASASDRLVVTFSGGVGVDPVAGTTGTAPNLTPTQNIVRGVNPPGDPWRIASLTAKIDTSGNITVVGTGLLLAGGNSIGTTDGVTSVIAKLFCGPAASATEFDSPGAPLDVQGDFLISGALSTTPPNPCTDPVLLIVNSAGAWLAAGFPQNF